MSTKTAIIIIDLSQNNVLHLRLLQTAAQKQKTVKFDKLDQTLLPQLEKFVSRHRLSWTEVSTVGLVLPSSFVTVRLALAVVNTLAWVHRFKVFFLPFNDLDNINFKSLKKYKPKEFLLPQYASEPRISPPKAKNNFI